MADRPREKNSDHHALNLLTLENWKIRLSPENVYFDLLEIFPLELRELNLGYWLLLLSFIVRRQNIIDSLVCEISEVVFDDLKVLLPFVFEDLFPELFVNGHVVQKQFPWLASLAWEVLGDAVPRHILKLFQFNVGLIRIQKFVDFYCLLLRLAYLNLLQDGLAIVVSLFSLGLTKVVFPEILEPIFKFLRSWQHLLLTQTDSPYLSSWRLESWVVVWHWRVLVSEVAA